MANEFYALLGRMRYITRWGLMRNSFSENIQEHSHQVAVLAHALALIRRDILQLPTPEPERCAVAALYHDASEILTGDMPTPIKYYNPAMKDAYKHVERRANQYLLDMLPQELRDAYVPYMLGRTSRWKTSSKRQTNWLPTLSAWRNRRRAIWNSSPLPGRLWNLCMPWNGRNLTGSSLNACRLLH